MSMWIIIAIVIEGVALLGALSVMATRRTRLAFVAGFNIMLPVTAVYVSQSGFGPREVLILAMVVVYLARMNWILFVWQGQTAVPKIDAKLPKAGQYFLPLVLTNTVGWGYCLPFYFAVRRPEPLEWVDGLALGIYVVGTVVHFGSDYQKRRFKLRPDNRGRILDTGFWSMSRHPNYFGDFLIYVSFAVIAGSRWGWAAPALNFLQYVFDAIPKNEKWAGERYGTAWDAYKARTKSFLPYMF